MTEEDDILDHFMQLLWWSIITPFVMSEVLCVIQHELGHQMCACVVKVFVHP